MSTPSTERSHAGAGQLGNAFADPFRSPAGITLQVLVLLASIGMVKLDWAVIATRRLRARQP
jgi:hypothetical protein